MTPTAAGHGTRTAAASPTARPPGRPRDPGVDRAVLDAAVDLLAERGFDALTMDAVAARAGVARASVYRRHANRTELLVAACRADAPAPPEPPATGSVRGDLVELCTKLSRTLQDSGTGRLLPTMLAASAAHPEVRAALATFLAGRRSPTAEVVRAAVARGELPGGTDPELVTDLLVGAVLHRTLLRGGRVGRARVEQLVDAVLGGVTARS